MSADCSARTINEGAPPNAQAPLSTTNIDPHTNGPQPPQTNGAQPTGSQLTLSRTRSRTNPLAASADDEVPHPGSIKINVQGAFIVDEADGVTTPLAFDGDSFVNGDGYGGTEDGTGHVRQEDGFEEGEEEEREYRHDIQDIRLPNHTAVVSHVAVDVRLSDIPTPSLPSGPIITGIRTLQHLTCTTNAKLCKQNRSEAPSANSSTSPTNLAPLPSAAALTFSNSTLTVSASVSISCASCSKNTGSSILDMELGRARTRRVIYASWLREEARLSIMMI